MKSRWYLYKKELVRIIYGEKASRKRYVVVEDILGMHKEVKKRKLKVANTES
jgi:hypothetical protein